MLVNLTGQTVTIYNTAGEPVRIDPDPRYVAISGIGDHRTLSDPHGHTFSINVRQVSGVKGMPDPRPGVVYVVPIEIAMALQEQRDDVVYLGEDSEVRDEYGRIRRISHLRRTVLRRPEPAVSVRSDGTER